MSLQQFIGVEFLEKKILILIFGIATFCLKHCLNSPRHTFNQILTNRWFYLLPLLLKLIPQLMNTTRRFFILPKLVFDMIPQMFYWVEVWGLRRPFHDFEPMVIEPSFGLFAAGLWVIVLLEGYFGCAFVVIGVDSLWFIIESWAGKVPIYPPS